jgi:hypothetical protein
MKMKNTTKLKSDKTIKIIPAYIIRHPSSIKKSILGMTPRGNRFWIVIKCLMVCAVYYWGMFLIEKVSMSSSMMGRVRTRGSNDELIVEK